MTLIEAMQSGKPFKRQGRKFWTIVNGDIFAPEIAPDKVSTLYPEDITATDYEVKEANQ